MTNLLNELLASFNVTSILLALLVLLFMITVHEFGHYVVAKIFNFKVNEFAIGMGPAIYKKLRKNGEIFSIRIIPLGGFCAFEGEDDDVADPRAFNNKKPWQRILVLIAGASMNFIAAILIFIISIGAYGQMCIGAFEVANPNSYTLQSNDVILSLNNTDIYTQYDLINALKNNKKNDIVKATVVRNGQRQNIEIKLAADPTSTSMQDLNQIYESLSIAALSGVLGTTEENPSPEKLLKGDYILRISDKMPVTQDFAGEGLTDCCLVNGDTLIQKYIDEATYLNEVRAFTPEDFCSLVSNFNEGDNLYIYVSRGSDRVLLIYTLTDFTQEVKQTNEGIFNYFGIQMVKAGYRMTTDSVKFGFFETIGRGVVYAFKNVQSTLAAFGQLFTGKLGLDALGGPITTITTTATYASYGLNYLLEIAGFIGISLAVFNLLPIPALDGARAVFVVIEWIRKKPINRNVEGVIHAVGLVVLFVFAIMIDLVKCI